MLREQVAVGAARGVGKVLSAIGMAPQANLACGARRIAVTRVAALTSLMLGLRMQPRKLASLVAAAASRRLGNTARSVGAMAGETTRRELAVRAVALGGVAGGAWFLRCNARVRLVAVAAQLMARGSALLLGFVATLAGFGLRPRVRLVAVGAHRVTDDDPSALGGVAAVATGLQRGRAVREPAVATLAVVVPGVGSRQLHRFGVAGLASLVLR